MVLLPLLIHLVEPLYETKLLLGPIFTFHLTIANLCCESVSLVDGFIFEK